MDVALLGPFLYVHDMVQYVSMILTPISNKPVILPEFVPCFTIICLFNPIAYTSWVSPLNFNISISYAPLRFDVFFIHCTCATLIFILVPNRFTVDFSISPLRFIVFYCLNIFFWWNLLAFVVVIDLLVVNFIFCTQVLFNISYHSSLICFMVIYDVFYDVFLFINFLVCLLQFYFWSNIIISSCVLLVAFIYIFPDIDSTPPLVYDQYISIFVYYLIFLFQIHILHFLFGTPFKKWTLPCYHRLIIRYSQLFDSSIYFFGDR